MGHGDRLPQDVPKRIEALESHRVVKIGCGGYHTFCLTSEDELFAFGAGTYGECGYGEAKDTLIPRKIKLPEK